MALRRLSPAITLALSAFLVRHNLHAPANIPVPIWHAALADDWYLRYASGMGKTHAISVIYKGIKLMQVNADLPVPYQRFAIAHEIAHVLCNHDSLVHLCGYAGSDWAIRRQEREADLVAAHLLVPDWVIRAYEDPPRIAGVADVPLDVVELRLGLR